MLCYYELEFPVFLDQSSNFLLSYISGAVGGLSDIEAFKSYQNQTAEDIESGRARYERYMFLTWYAYNIHLKLPAKVQFYD